MIRGPMSEKVQNETTSLAPVQILRGPPVFISVDMKICGAILFMERVISPLRAAMMFPSIGWSES